MRLPVHDFTGSGLEETAAYAQGQADGVLLCHCGNRRISVKEKQEGNAEYGAAEAGLNDVRGQGKADDSAGNRAGRSDERNGQRKPQAREVAAQKAGPGGQGAREGHHEAGAPHEVEMKGKEACHKRHEENASAHAGHDGDNAEHETENEEASGPEPPRVTVCLIRGTGICRDSLGGRNAVLRLPRGCGDRGQSAGRSRLTLHHLSRGLTGRIRGRGTRVNRKSGQQKEKHDRGKNETAPEGKPAEENVRLTRSFLTISVFRDSHTPLSHTQSPLSPTAV